MNSFGNLFKITTFGESHGKAIGGIIDGMPSGIEIDLAFIQSELNRRRPGQSSIVSPRKESDKVEILSGVFEGKSTGTPIGFAIYNEDQHSTDYNNIEHLYRPSHADFTYSQKYGIRDYRGGGRSSARETAARCVAGAFAKLALRQTGISITAYCSQIGEISLDTPYQELDLTQVEQNIVRCPNAEKATEMIALLEKIKGDGDTVGGIVSCVIRNTPIGLGAPVFNKLHADLGAAMLGINAAKGFEYGMGFAGAARKGSEMCDRFITQSNQIKTLTNHSGGIQGGISNGEDIYFRVAFKPIATLLQPIETIDDKMQPVVLQAKGRHDPCVVPRAVPIVEAMAAIVILDHYLLNKATTL